MPENDPISMFWGFQVMVATLPIFDDVATAASIRQWLQLQSARDAEDKRHHHEAHNNVHERCGGACRREDHGGR